MSDALPPETEIQYAPEELLQLLLFSETKDLEDAMGISGVVMNRLARPERFGKTLDEVIYAPHQFSGVGSPEWEKAATGNLTEEEQKIFDSFGNVATGVLSGVIPDPTGGADHYYNPKLASPKWGETYPETYKTDFHRYLKEK